jgi:signal transduction histidine kinase/HAMP domain-containing protein
MRSTNKFMLTDWTIRRRLVVITVGLSVLILAIVAALTVNASNELISQQTQAILLGRNQSFANALEANMRDYAVSTSGVAAIMSGSSANSLSTLLLRQASELLNAPESTVHYINVIIPKAGGYQVVTAHRPDQADAVISLSQTNRPDLPYIEWLQQAANARSVTWYGPHDSYEIRDNQQVISVAAPLPRPTGRENGVMWIEITLDDLYQQVYNTLRVYSSEENRGGYSLLINEQGELVSVYGLSLQGIGSSGALMESLRNRDDLQAIIRGTLADANGFITASDPLNGRQAYAVRSILPSNNWVLVSVVPVTLFENPLQRSLFQVILIALIGIIVLGIIIDQFVENSIATPLTRIATAAQEIGSGDMRYQIGYSGRNDEIGKLALALDDMKVNLAHSYEELALWSRRLEKRVTERTEELEGARADAQATAAELQAVYDSSLSVVSEYNLRTILDKLIERVEAMLRANYVGVWLITIDGSRLQLVNSSLSDTGDHGRLISVDEGLAGRVVQEQKALIIDDYLNWPHRLGWLDPQMAHALCVPLTFYGRQLGAVVVGRGAGDALFDKGDQQLLTLFANLVSPAVRNAQLYAQVNDAQQQAESANQVKTRFLASVTHELRTPLNLIINNMDFMRVGVFGDVNNEQRERLDQTIRSAEHLLYLINDLLDISKIEAGEMQLFFQPTDLHPVIEDTLDSTLAVMGDNTKVALLPEIPADLPMVTMDARRVRQVLLNLLSNAVKFTQEGVVRFEVLIEPENVIFKVTDTGIGIPAEEIDSIFEAFERSKPSQHMGIEGTGLGLPISRFLVEAHGGNIRVESEVGKGSTFIVTLPMQPADIEVKAKSAAFIGHSG